MTINVLIKVGFFFLSNWSTCFRELHNIQLNGYLFIYFYYFLIEWDSLDSSLTNAIKHLINMFLIKMLLIVDLIRTMLLQS